MIAVIASDFSWEITKLSAFKFYWKFSILSNPTIESSNERETAFYRLFSVDKEGTGIQKVFCNIDDHAVFTKIPVFRLERL